MARLAMLRTLALLSLTALFTLHSQAEAQGPGEVAVVDPIDIPPAHDPLAHAWDIPGQRGGFYLRASTSIGVNNTRLGPASWESGSTGVTVNGFGSGYGLDLGGFVRPWLALHVDASLGILWNGSVNDDFGIVGQGDTRARVLAYGVAPAVTFFTPRNFFFKPAFGVGWATTKSGSYTNTTNPGFYMHLVAGKDLYTDTNFSFGLQFEIAYMRLGADNREEEARVRQFLFGLSFGFNSI